MQGRCSSENGSSLWGRKMDFAACNCEGPWDNTVNTVKCFLNWSWCKMCHAWIIGYRLALQSRRLCWVPVSLSPHWAGEGAYILASIALDECVHISRVIFSMIKHVENLWIKCPASELRANQSRFLIKGAVVPGEQLQKKKKEKKKAKHQPRPLFHFTMQQIPCFGYYHDTLLHHSTGPYSLSMSRLMQRGLRLAAVWKGHVRILSLAAHRCRKTAI